MNRPARQLKYEGFTLIEVLASMAVLVVIMLVLLRVFNEATTSFNRGNNIVLRTGAARAVLDVMRKDIEGAVVDGKVGFFKEADTYDGNEDRIAMVTMGGDPNDGRAYQLVQYYVTASTTNGYTNATLVRAYMNLDTAMKNGIDPFDPNQEWWKSTNGYSSDPVMESVVRFDIWVCDASGANLLPLGSRSVFGGNSPYDSRKETNKPPAYIDIYLQVTSDSTMKRAALLLSRSGGGAEDDLRRKGYSLLYQDSNVLFERVTPLMGNGERLHPLTY